MLFDDCDGYDGYAGRMDCAGRIDCAGRAGCAGCAGCAGGAAGQPGRLPPSRIKFVIFSSACCRSAE